MTPPRRPFRLATATAVVVLMIAGCSWETSDDEQVETTDTENALRLEAAFYDADFSDLAGQVSVPTLVMHCRDDNAAPYAEGRRLAGLIPDAEFVTLDSPNHILTEDEPAWPDFLRHMERVATLD